MDTTRNLDVVDRKIASHYWQQTRWFNVVYSTDSFDSSNGHEPKRGFCWAENRISLLTTDPAVQRCWFDRFVQFVEWTRPKTWLLLIGNSHLISNNIPGSRFMTKVLWKSTYKHMNIPRSKNTSERGYKHMNIPCSKNIACWFTPVSMPRE